MFYYSVILLALAGTVRTSVVINVFEDGEIKASHSLRGGCNFRACDQLCRRLGFKGGVCVGDRCKCDIITPLTDEKADHSMHDSCNFQACDQLCRRLGFKGGVCVGDRCKCDIIMPLTEKADYSMLDSCNFQACDQLCRRLGFKSGVCVGDKCNCDNFASLTERKAHNSLSASCTDSVCDQLCRRLGFKGGACVRHMCSCDSLTGKTLDFPLSSAVKNKASHSYDDCNFQACDQLCRNLGFPGGACIGDKCDCDNFKKEKESNYLNEVEDKDDSDGDEENNHVMRPKDQSEAASVREFCDIVKCNEMCHRLNYIGGMCRNGSCQCY